MLLEWETWGGMIGTFVGCMCVGPTLALAMAFHQGAVFYRLSAARGSSIALQRAER